MVIQALAENNSSATPTTEELAGWADTYGQTIPVVADEGWAIESRFAQDNGIPSFSLIAPGGEVIAADNYGDAMAKIDEVLPQDFEYIEREE